MPVRILLRYGCLCLALLVAVNLHAQEMTDNSLLFSTDKPSVLEDSTHLFTIRGIDITGNKRTKPVTIFRELSFQVSGQYPLNVIVDKFYEARKQLMNTG